MKPPPFAYHRPETRDEVDRLLRGGIGDEAKILAGGQSLIPILNMRLDAPEHLIDISRLADEPREPAAGDGVVRFGPLVRHADPRGWKADVRRAPSGSADDPPAIADASKQECSNTVEGRAGLVTCRVTGRHAAATVQRTM